MANLQLILSFVLLGKFSVVFINADWSTWREWTACSVTCGDGLILRTRKCINSIDFDFQSTCSGSASQVLPCNLEICPTFCNVIKAVNCSDVSQDSINDILQDNSINNILAEVSHWSLDYINSISRCFGNFGKFGSLNKNVDDLKNNVVSLTNANNKTYSVLGKIRDLIACSEDGTSKKNLYSRCNLLLEQNKSVRSKIAQLQNYRTVLDNVLDKCKLFSFVPQIFFQVAKSVIKI